MYGTLQDSGDYDITADCNSDCGCPQFAMMQPVCSKVDTLLMSLWLVMMMQPVCSKVDTLLMSLWLVMMMKPVCSKVDTSVHY